MNKSDYDKYYKKGGTYVIPVELFNELFDELERLSFNYEQALEDLEKKDNIINEFDKWLLGERMMFYNGDGETLIRYNETKNKWLELKGENNDK